MSPTESFGTTTPQISLPRLYGLLNFKATFFPPITHSVEPVDSSPEPPQASIEPKREEPQLIAQNNPEPQTPRVVEPAPAPVQPKAEESAELPKTATPFPLIGLGGLGSLVVLGLLRIKHLG